MRAKYTIHLKTLLDNEDSRVAIENALSTYPLYVGENTGTYGLIPKREELNRKILNHYKYREIGFESVGRFIDELEIAMCEIMPFYNQLFKSVDIINGVDDIFENVNMTETFEQSSEGSSEGSSKGTSKDTSEGTSEGTTNSTTNSEANSNTNTNSSVNSYGKNIESMTPQGNISLANTEIDSVTYADNIKWNHNSSTDTSTSEGTDTTEATTNQTTTGSTSNTSENETNNTTESSRSDTLSSTLSRRGNQGVRTYASDIVGLRELFMNIEQRIIKDERIAELFMQVF